MCTIPGPSGLADAADLVAASLLTSASGAEVHIVARDGRRMRLAADEETARALAMSLWRAIEEAD